MKKTFKAFIAGILSLAMILPTAIMPVMAEGEGTDEKYSAPESPAVTYNMNVDWKFKKASGTVYPLASALASVKQGDKEFYAVDYDDSDWETVSVPHAINAEDSFDGLGIDAGEAGLYRGFMFYRKKITIPVTTASKYFLEFEAFRQSVYLYVNGRLVGYYEAGVAPVGFDITDYVTPGEEALIAVATDNSAGRGNNNDTKETKLGSITYDSETNTYNYDNANNGWSFQWNTNDFNETQGGITGNVNLYAKGNIYQTLPLYNNLKTTGNYIYGDNFNFSSTGDNPNSADITVEAEVRNESDAAKDITLEVNVVDGDGNCVATFNETANVAAAADTDSDQFISMVPENAYDAVGIDAGHNEVDISTVDVTKITATQKVSNLHFWSDKSPYLYDVYTVLKDGDTVIDVQKTTTGFRETTYDKDQGYKINGIPTYLKGYAQRSTNEWAAIGVANDWLTDIDMQLVKESNANFIRWMHIAPNPVDIRGGDKYGVVSIVPAGDKEGESTGRNWDQRLEAMRDVIIYFRNSPSALFWEAGNQAISPAKMKAMTDLRKALAPSSDTRMGCRTISSKEQVAETEWVGTMLYRNDKDAYASMEAANNYVPMLETEYHRDEAPRRVWDDFSPPYYDYVNKYLNGGSKEDGFDVWDETQENFSTTMFNTTDGYSYYYNNRVGGSGKNYYTGAAMMVWSDSNMHVRNCGVENCRTSGRVDPIRVKKESFYAIQAAQSDTPKVHILGHWNYPEYTKADENGNYWYYEPKWNGHNFEVNASCTKVQRDPTKKTVYVIGSEAVSKVELYVNDELVGTDETATDNYIYAFDNIDVTKSGTIVAKAYTEESPATAVTTDEDKTVGEAARIKLTPVYGPDNSLRADGSDLAYVDVEIVDEEGNVCPLDERKINFTVSDPTVAKFLGGYNSGYYGNTDGGYNEPGGRIVNHKDYVFAECGTNRVFLQATRKAGDVTLTATAEGMQPATITINSQEFTTTNGLSTVAQQSFEQGQVPEPPKPETVASLKSLGDVFTADWTEETGNVIKVNEDEKDYYTVKVNDTEVSFTDRAYKPDSSTGVVGEITPILEALKSAGATFTYAFHNDGSLPSYAAAFGKLPYITISDGDNTIDAVNDATDIFINGERNLSNFMVIPNSTNTTLLAELSSVIGQLEGVSLNTDAENKVLSITYTAPPTSPSSVMSLMADTSNPATLTYIDGIVTVTANEKIENAKLVIAGYKADGSLNKLISNDVTLETGAKQTVTITDDITEFNNAKAMLWQSIESMKPLADAVDCKEVYKIDEVYKYDKVGALDVCDTAVTNTVLSEDTNSPDGTSYLKNTSYSDWKGACLSSSGLGANSKADIMWEADVRFDTDGAGVGPFDQGDKKAGTCVRRHDEDDVPYLAIQTGGSSFTKYIQIDPAKWYHIALVGRFSAPDAVTDMYVYEYNGSEKTFLNVYKGVNQRNMSANNSSGASHWNVNQGTSVDNLKITLLGADKLKVTSDEDSLKAGNVLQMNYSATRQGEYITSPDVVWSVYDENNENQLDSASGITIDNGILNVALDAESQKVNVRATATVNGNEIYAYKTVQVEAVDTSNVKFDTLTLATEDDYVSSNKPMTITVNATKGGNAVTLENSDLIWYACDKTDMVKLGDNLKWINIENGVVTVDPKAITQDIVIRAADPEDKVRGSLPIHVKGSDVLEGNEDGKLDRLLTADNGETIAMTNTETVDSIDGTHAYKATAGYPTANIAETAGDIVVEMDIKFNSEGAGFQPAKSGKVNTCVVYHNGKFCVQTGGTAYTQYCDIDSSKWYHITLIRKKDAYAHIVLEEYDANGNRTNKQIFTDVNQRNNEPTAFVNINAGTSYDNLRIMTPVVKDISINTDVKTVFAGNNVQATATLYWKDNLEMKQPDSSLFAYKLYDSDNANIIPDSNKTITVDASGLIKVDALATAQDYYVRAVSTADSSLYDSAKFTVSSSSIMEVKQLGVNDEENRLVRMFVDKKFYYNDEVTFVITVTDKNGNITATYLKQTTGSALSRGETNTIALGYDLPAGFDKTKDTINIYAVTKVNSDEEMAEDENMTLTSAGTGTALSNIPGFDAGATVLVMALKPTATETNVKAEDILYFAQMKSDNITENSVNIPVAVSGMTVKISGNVGGVHTVAKAKFNAS